MKASPGENRAIFLDRDGTLVVERNYLKDPALLEIFPGVPEALKRLQDGGFKLFVVTNQSGIGRGYYTVEDMHRVNARLMAELAPRGVQVRQDLFCTGSPRTAQSWAKTVAQFLFDARDEFGIDLAASYMIGDKLIDLECGRNAGVMQSILVRTGYGADVEKMISLGSGNTLVFDTLSAAVDRILST